MRHTFFTLLSFVFPSFSKLVGNVSEWWLHATYMKCTQQHKANLLFSKSVSGTFFKHTFTVMRLHGKKFYTSFLLAATYDRNQKPGTGRNVPYNGNIILALSIIQTLYTDMFVFSYERRCEVTSSFTFSFPLHSALVESIESTFLCSDLFGT